MKTSYFKIDMDIVKKIIRDKGFYYIRADKLFDDHYTGPQYYIVTNEPNFIITDPKFMDSVVMTTIQFEPIAEAINKYTANDDRERHRFAGTISADYQERSLWEISSADYERSLIVQQIKDAISTLNEVQKRRITMYFFENKTQLEIAELEGVRLFAVQKSIDSAIKKLKKTF